MEKIMKKWEYQIQSIPNTGNAVHVLNKLGDQGWELGSLFKLSGTIIS